MNRLVTRGPNPFAPLAKIKNQQMTLSNPYEVLTVRVKPLLTNKDIVAAKDSLHKRLDGVKYEPHHFGRLELIDYRDIDINVDIQRLLEISHVASIIELFDPRIIQPVNVIYIKETGRYSAWDGQQSSATFAILYYFGMIDENTKIQCKVVDDDLEVPGSDLVGEAVGNYGFRRLNGNGRKPVDVYFTHRSRVNGVRRYGSCLREDQQSHEIQEIIERHHMFTAPSIDAQNNKAKPGMITYITGVNTIAGHDTAKEHFDVTKTDLDYALSWHDRYFPLEKGVDGGIILALGRLHASSRGRPSTKSEPAEPAVPLTEKFGEELADIIRSRYLNPAGFHAACKDRLKIWQLRNLIRPSWSDSCLAPFLVMDYVEHGGTQAVPVVPAMNLYAGV